jgi:hypothetical protein
VYPPGMRGIVTGGSTWITAISPYSPPVESSQSDKEPALARRANA